MSNSVWSHRRQPTRLPCPWDSPGKNTGVGCHFLLQCMEVKSESEAAQSCPTPSDPMDCSLPGSSVHRIFQTRVLEWGAIAFSIKCLGVVFWNLSFLLFSELPRPVGLVSDIYLGEEFSFIISSNISSIPFLFFLILILLLHACYMPFVVVQYSWLLCSILF